MATTALRTKRQEKKWTLEYVAEAVGVTKQSIHDFETGKTRPSYDVLMTLCKLFNAQQYSDVERLFTVADGTPPTQPQGQYYSNAG